MKNYIKKTLIIIPLLSCLLQSNSFSNEKLSTEERAWLKQVIIDKKCTMCHTAFSLGIGKPSKDDDSSATPDLTRLKDEISKDNEKAKEFLKAFMTKQTRKNGKLHRTKLMLTGQDLDRFVESLLKLNLEAGQ